MGGLPGLTLECVRGQGWRGGGEGGNHQERGGCFQRDKPRVFNQEEAGRGYERGQALQLIRGEMSISGEGGYRKSFLVENLGHTEWIPENSLGKYAIYFNNINNTY